MDNIRRLLGYSDLDAYIDLASKYKKIGGSKAPAQDFWEEIYGKYFMENSAYQSFGYFKEDTLVSVINVAYRENNSRGKFWVIPILFSLIKSNIFSFNRPEIGLLIKKVFDNSESLGYYDYYYVIAEHLSNVYEKQIDKNIYIPLQRYERITLDTIPKHTTPTVDLYQKLIGDPKPHNMVIKKRVLKPEFRLLNVSTNNTK